MFDLDNWQEIFQTLTRNKTRSFLTAFGIFWGMFMLLLLIGGGHGVKKLMDQNFEGVAQNSCFISNGITSLPYEGFQTGRKWSLDINDVQLLKRKVPALDIVTPIRISDYLPLTYKSKKRTMSCRGLLTDYAQVETPHIIYGRFLNNQDEYLGKKVCIIGYNVYTFLFQDGENPCGQFVTFNGSTFQIIGVEHHTSNANIMGNPNDMITIPLTTFNKIFPNSNKVDLITITVKPPFSVSSQENNIIQTVKAHHHIAPKDEHAVFYFNLEQMFQIISNLFEGIDFLIWLIGIGTILAGIIGVTNIMLVTVRERTTEIGIRRAIGAKPINIITQFMTESILLTLAAGMSGVLMAVGILGLSNVIAHSNGLTTSFQISFNFAVSAFIILTCLGTIAGVAPTLRALSIKPIDAIRDE